MPWFSNAEAAMQPAHFSLEGAIRPKILALPAYVTSTSDEFQPRSTILMDANENSLGSCLTTCPSADLGVDEQVNLNDDLALAFSEITRLHRYPSASQWQLKRSIAEWRGLSSARNICLGVGAADIVDLVIRMACTPSKDAILTTPPTFGLYRSRAALNDVEVIECPLEVSNGDFVLPIQEIFDQLECNPQVKVIFLASPGNPTGTLISRSDIKRILDFPGFKGILVADEAYIDFCPLAETVSALDLLPKYANLLVLQTLSKSHGLAGLRLGMAFAHTAIIEILSKIQMPYCVSSPTSALAMLSLTPACEQLRRQLVARTIANREKLIFDLAQSQFIDLGVGKPLGGNQANFILLPILKRNPGVTHARDNPRARTVSDTLKKVHGISVRFIGDLQGCEACMRITIGTEEENTMLVETLKAVLEVF
ncbi:histidinol-phosphate transaminase [Trapelia coarctata]|nr:histidinol-phosphate transaminase [Trapelia coarctata]